MQSLFIVDGMSCSHCVNAVSNAVLAIAGVTVVDVDLANKTVAVTHNETVSGADIKNAIEEQGYDVR